MREDDIATQGWPCDGRTCRTCGPALLTNAARAPRRRSLRDDVAFKLTYSLGRQGQLQKGQVVGHPAATLAGAPCSWPV